MNHFQFHQVILNVPFCMYTSSDLFNFQYHIRCFSNYVVLLIEKLIGQENESVKFYQLQKSWQFWKSLINRVPQMHHVLLLSWLASWKVRLGKFYRIVKNCMRLQRKAVVNERNWKVGSIRKLKKFSLSRKFDVKLSVFHWAAQSFKRKH